MLTNDDINVLMEALDALQSKASSDGFSQVLLGALLSSKEDKESWKADADKTMLEAKQKSESIKETVVLLKAKLIQMRDSLAISEMANILKGN